MQKKKNGGILHQPCPLPSAVARFGSRWPPGMGVAFFHWGQARVIHFLLSPSLGQNLSVFHSQREQQACLLFTSLEMWGTSKLPQIRK